MRAILFHNPTAGSEGHSAKSLSAVLRLAGYEVEYCSTKSDEFEGMLAEGADLYIVAGGDGTVAKVAIRMPNRAIPIAILPIGTANNIARSLGICGSLVQLAEELPLAQVRRFDVGSIRGPDEVQRFIESVGFGPMATAMRSAEQNLAQPVDQLRICRAKTQHFLRERTVLDMDALVDGHPLPDDLVALEIVNIAVTGPALPLAPGADPSDGCLDIVGVRRDQVDDMVAWLSAPFARSCPATVWRGSSIEVRGNIPQHRIDDDVASSRDAAAATVELERIPVQVLVPASARIT